MTPLSSSPSLRSFFCLVIWVCPNFTCSHLPLHWPHRLFEHFAYVHSYGWREHMGGKDHMIQAISSVFRPLGEHRVLEPQGKQSGITWELGSQICKILGWSHSARISEQAMRHHVGAWLLNMQSPRTQGEHPSKRGARTKLSTLEGELLAPRQALLKIKCSKSGWIPKEAKCSNPSRAPREAKRSYPRWAGLNTLGEKVLISQASTLGIQVLIPLEAKCLHHPLIAFLRLIFICLSYYRCLSYLHFSILSSFSILFSFFSSNGIFPSYWIFVFIVNLHPMEFFGPLFIFPTCYIFWVLSHHIFIFRPLEFVDPIFSSYYIFLFYCVIPQPS